MKNVFAQSALLALLAGFFLTACAKYDHKHAPSGMETPVEKSVMTK